MEHNQASAVVTLVERYFPSPQQLKSTRQVIDGLISHCLSTTELDKLNEKQLMEVEEMKRIALKTSKFFDELTEELTD